MEYATLSNKTTKTCSLVNNNEEIIDLLNLTFIDPEYYQYEIFKVPAEFIARPDLISLKKYGTDNYVDIICKLNGISNPFELNEGDLIILPETGLLKMFYYKSDTIDNDEEINKLNGNWNPVPKRRNEERKANEAVIGDKRFRIDKDRNVVIY